jgi:hypothetical protein
MSIYKALEECGLSHTHSVELRTSCMTRTGMQPTKEDIHGRQFGSHVVIVVLVQDGDLLSRVVYSMELLFS